MRACVYTGRVDVDVSVLYLTKATERRHQSFALMLVVEPAPKPPASATPSAPSSSYNTPVHIDIDSDDDDSSSSTSSNDELTKRQHVVDHAAQVKQRRAGALEIETNEESVPARTAPSASPSPVSRLNGYVAGADMASSESTGSSPHIDRRRSGVNSKNAAFFKSVREDLWPRPSPTKASLKRPLVLQSDRRQGMQGRAQNSISMSSGDTSAPAPVATAAGNGSVSSVQKVTSESPERKTVPNGYKSSSDSSDLDEEKDEDEIIIPPPVKKPKPDTPQAPTLDFFMRPSQVPFATERVSAAQNVAAVAAAAQQSQQHTRICSSRTRICGHVFGRCELIFSDRSVELALWRQGESEMRIWQGTLKYAHLRRFWYVVMMLFLHSIACKWAVLTVLLCLFVVAYKFPPRCRSATLFIAAGGPIVRRSEHAILRVLRLDLCGIRPGAARSPKAE